MSFPTPFFSRLALGHHADVQILCRDEDLRFIGTLPTLDHTITWSICGPLDDADPEALFTLVIWNSSLSQSLAKLFQNLRYSTPVIILFTDAQIPPFTINDKLTSRLRFEGSVQDVLLQMIPSLVVPVIYDGLIGVDHADIKLAIDHGGMLRQFEHRGWDIQHAIDAILCKASRHLMSLSANAAVCVGLFTSTALTMKHLDDFIRKIHKNLHPEAFVVVSAVSHDGEEAIASILTISGESDDSVTRFNT